VTQNLTITQVGAGFTDSAVIASALSLTITQFSTETEILGADAGASNAQLAQSIALIVAVPAAPLGIGLTIGPAATVSLALPGSVIWGEGGGSAYDNPAYPALTTINDALDYLLYVPPAITGFTNTVGTVEIGSTVTAVTLSWHFNKTMASVTLNGAAISPLLTSASLTGLHLTSDTSYTLSASDGQQAASAGTSVAFRARRWWGTSALTTLGSADILTLSGSEFATGRGQSRSMSASAAYLYFAWPSAFGAPTFTVNGLPSTAWIKTTVMATNAAGYAQNYDVYRSQYIQNGSGIAVVVS
jgi:hypothetical protein